MYVFCRALSEVPQDGENKMPLWKKWFYSEKMLWERMGLRKSLWKGVGLQEAQMRESLPSRCMPSLQQNFTDEVSMRWQDGTHRLCRTDLELRKGDFWTVFQLLLLLRKTSSKSTRIINQLFFRSVENCWTVGSTRVKSSATKVNAGHALFLFLDPARVEKKWQFSRVRKKSALAGTRALSSSSVGFTAVHKDATNHLAGL